MLVEVGLRSLIGSLDQPLLVPVVQTKKPGGIALATLTDDIIEMAPVPAFPAPILQLSMSPDLRKREPLK